MVPHQNKYTPQAMVPDEASCRNVNTIIVTEYIKSKMTRECNLSLVTFINKGFEGAADLLPK